MRILGFVVASMMVVPTMVPAQQSPAADSVPRAGMWAAEVVLGPSITGASLIRFTSRRVALLLGADVNVTHYEQDVDGFNPLSSTRSTVNGRVGIRRYRASSSERLLPLVGAGVRGGYSKLESNYHTWNTGAYGELGAVYLIGSHVSLGATGEVSAIYGKTKQTSNATTSTSTQTSFGASLVRVLASVYF
jgi:hypothetical protein